ncbi:MAG: mechanosensitive ion channel family protein [Acidobacteriota bacterium]
MPDLTTLPAWALPIAWTLGTVAAAWALGYLIGARLVAQVPRWLPGARPAIVDTAVVALRRGLPRWTLLVGIWIAAGYWPLPPDVRLVVERAVFAIAGLSITLAIAAVAARAVDTYGEVVAPALPATSLTRHITRALVVILGVLVILNGLGVSITPMLTALGVGGLAVALALQEPLANLFAGLFVTLSGQIRVGDYVRLDSGQEGYVVDFSWRSTRLRMLPNNLVVVPNAKLSQAIVVNHNLPSLDMAVLVDVGVDYASDLARVERVVMEVGREVMREVQGGVPDFEPFIRYHTFGESSVNFTTILRAREFVDQYLVKHEFIKRLHARFEREGIVIPFPIRTIVDRRNPVEEPT